ncbi:hypothetical protein CAL26_05195 [Bordetella genomosp. 9]|uniref:Uncharacterized protein n=1 Tax=Bordetella genomosp. 9 TaxID=1416803 RepID=A0A261RNV8_9BORD|nr:hypothetical protein [Bordetella genomosp. 9]OZI26719.1 hypothetical protein CAL26_05195 [Bordetella genomosp. 9]
MLTTLNPGLLQSLQAAGQQADQARRQREMMLQQQQQRQQQQGGGINTSMLNQFLPKAGGNNLLGSTDGMTGSWLPVSQAGGLGGLGGLTAAPGVSLAGSGAATSGIGAGGTLGAFAEGGGAAAGGAAGGGSAGAGLAAFWPAAVVAAAVGNEMYAKNHGYRRDGADYYKDLATGRVLSQDVDNRWSPMIFGKNDNMGFGHDASFAADVGSFQFGKAFKDLKKSSLLTGFGILG